MILRYAVYIVKIRIKCAKITFFFEVGLLSLSDTAKDEGQLQLWTKKITSKKKRLFKLLI